MAISDFAITKSPEVSLSDAMDQARPALISLHLRKIFENDRSTH